MRTVIFFLMMGLFCAPVSAVNPLRVVTTTEDLASLAKAVGGDRVEVESLSTGDQDLHLVEPRPSMVMKLKKADVVVKVGMDLDMWIDSLISASRNARLPYGAPGHLDASSGIQRLQIPTTRIDGSMGDLHIFGNPHYWLDPENAITITQTLCEGLSRVSPADKAVFEENRREFLSDLKLKLEEWSKRMERLRGKPIVTYHNSWVYFAERYGLEVVGHIEPKPGLPPTPSHLAGLIDLMKKKDVRVILVESFYPLSGPRKVSQKTGATVLVVASSVGGKPGVGDFFALFDQLTQALSTAYPQPCGGTGVNEQGACADGVQSR